MYIEVGCYLTIGSYYKNRNEKRKPGLHSSFRWLTFVCEKKKKKKNHQRLISPPLFNSFSLPTEQSKWTMMFLLDPCARALSPSTTDYEVIEKELLLRAQYSGPDVPSAFWLQNEYSQIGNDWRGDGTLISERRCPGQLSRGIGQLWTFGSLGLSKKQSFSSEQVMVNHVTSSQIELREFFIWNVLRYYTAGLFANVISPVELG